MTHQAHPVHHVRGRIRIKIPSAKGEAAALQRVKEAIAPLAGVRDVTINSSTASIVVTYDPARHECFANELIKHGRDLALFELEPPQMAEAERVAQTIEEEAAFLSEQSETAKSVIDFVKAINVQVRKATNNTLDLKVLLPFGLALFSMVQMETDISTPLWATLGIFSFNSFLTLHHPQAPCADGGGSVVAEESSPATTLPASNRASHAV